jgi:dihydroorotase
MKLLIKNGNILCHNGEMQTVDIRIEEGKIAEIGKHLKASGETIMNADGKLVAPGFIDVHVHLREPGGEQKETIETGTLAAARGGFTTICAMPNTKPVPDTVEHLKNLKERIKENAHVRVLPYASITVKEAGQELTDFESLQKEGAFAFTDDGAGVQNAGIMLKAMKKAAALQASVVAHCEDNTLVFGGVVHDGVFAKTHNIQGIPSVCEAVHIARDVLLAEAAGCHYHVCHISTKESVRTVRDAKKAGIHVTAEVTPHHLLLTEEDIPGLDANYKMNPPLRSKEDREALINGLLDGTIDCIATDHAPHTIEDKQAGIYKAPFGIVGLETAFPLLYSRFVQTGIFTLKKLVDWMTIKPAEIFKLPYGRLEEGAAADLVIIDLNLEKEIVPQHFASKGRNTPFGGWKCKGWPIATFVNGKLVWQEGRVHA